MCVGGVGRVERRGEGGGAQGVRGVGRGGDVCGSRDLLLLMLRLIRSCWCFCGSIQLLWSRGRSHP